MEASRAERHTETKANKIKERFPNLAKCFGGSMEGESGVSVSISLTTTTGRPPLYRCRFVPEDGFFLVSDRRLARGVIFCCVGQLSAARSGEARARGTNTNQNTKGKKNGKRETTRITLTRINSGPSF